MNLRKYRNNEEVFNGKKLTVNISLNTVLKKKKKGWPVYTRVTYNRITTRFRSVFIPEYYEKNEDIPSDLKLKEKEMVMNAFKNYSFNEELSILGIIAKHLDTIDVFNID